jgi:uncharacterized membrane protein
MSDINSSLFIITYEGRDTANQVYDTLNDLQKQDKLKIKTAATAWRKDNGKLKLWAHHRVTFWKGLWGGGAIGLVLGAITVAATGPAVIGAAAVGGLVGLSRSRQRRDAKKFLDEKLGQNDSALVILVRSAARSSRSDRRRDRGGRGAGSLVVITLNPSGPGMLMGKTWSLASSSSPREPDWNYPLFIKEAVRPSD